MLSFHSCNHFSYYLKFFGHHFYVIICLLPFFVFSHVIIYAITFVFVLLC
jgi:hypothetical protein